MIVISRGFLKKALIALIIILVVIFAAVYLITSSGTHYSSNDTAGKEISFNYPTGWAFEDQTAGVVIQGEKNATNSTSSRAVVTISKISAGGTSVDKIKSDDTYVKTGKIVNETNLTVDGTKAIAVTIEEMGGPEIGKIGESKLILFTKNGNIYKISFVTGDTIKTIQSDIDFIVNSFHTT
jgi:hypothetical protein